MILKALTWLLGNKTLVATTTGTAALLTSLYVYRNLQLCFTWTELVVPSLAAILVAVFILKLKGGDKP